MVSFTSAILASVLSVSVFAIEIKVAASGGNATSGHQYGFLHEDINNSGDGGVYAELIRNRAFQYSQRYPVSLDGWTAINGAKLELKELDKPLSDALPVSMRVSPGSDEGVIGFFNDGYWGMSVKKQKYTGSFWVKGSYNGTFTASLQSALTDDVFGSVKIESAAAGDEWVEHGVAIVPEKDAPNSNNTFAITFDPSGLAGDSLDFNLISLFPPTYKDRKNGLRPDIMEALEGFHPTIFRIPGGNMLEGDNNASYWDWKKTLGPLRERPGFQGVWDYMQTNGLGLYEYLLWAEDFNMQVVVAVWAGLSLNGDITPKDKLQPFIDDALDEIDFIRGSTDTKWGAYRAALGHPKPFPLKYIEIGNEDWLAGGAEGWRTYRDYRFPMFMEAIRAKHPDLTIIASGATSDGYQVESPGIGDYHPYRTPDSLVNEFNRFDNDPIRHIVGEVAATHPNGGIGWDGPLFTFPWWIGTVGEAVSMIGYERNCDRVDGTFYAPILRNMNRWQWAVTMIQHTADPAQTTRSTSWYLWELFASKTMKETLPTTKTFDPLFYVAGIDDDGATRIWKGAVYNTTGHADVPVSLRFDGVGPGAKATLKVLTGLEGPYGFNNPLKGNNVVNSTSHMLKANTDGTFEFVLPELSVALLTTKPIVAEEANEVAEDGF